MRSLYNASLTFRLHNHYALEPLRFVTQNNNVYMSNLTHTKIGKNQDTISYSKN
jgi:hypothetical protein